MRSGRLWFVPKTRDCQIASLHISFPTPNRQRKRTILSHRSSLSLLDPKKKGKRKNYRNRKTGAWEVDTQILYTIHDLPTNHGIPPTGAMQFVSKGGQKKKPKEKKEKRPYGHDHHLVLGQSSRRHSHMRARAHQTRRGNSHVGRPSKAIEFSWRRRGRWCVRGNPGCQLFEGG
jgi:hypothetical protein